MNVKFCNGCKKMAEFYKNRGRKDGLQTQCKDCLHTLSLAWGRAHRDQLNEKQNAKYSKDATYERKIRKSKSKTFRDWYLKTNHGITEEQFVEMLLVQGGKCAICGDASPKKTGKSAPFVVDHEHKTGKIRGILCNLCNMGIGLLRDNPEIARLAAFYLESRSDYDARTNVA